MPAEPERCADLFDSPSVEALYALTSREAEGFANCLLLPTPLTFEQASDLYAPPAHEPELLDDPEREPAFLQAGALRMGASGFALESTLA